MRKTKIYLIMFKPSLILYSVGYPEINYTFFPNKLICQTSKCINYSYSHYYIILCITNSWKNNGWSYVFLYHAATTIGSVILSYIKEILYGILCVEKQAYKNFKKYINIITELIVSKLNLFVSTVTGNDRILLNLIDTKQEERERYDDSEKTEFSSYWWLRLSGR